MKRFVASLLLMSGLLLAGAAKSATIFENILNASTASIVSSSFSQANIIPATASGTVDTITLYLRSVTANTITVKVCTPISDQPTNCVVFSQQGNIPAQPGYVNFTSQIGYVTTANTNFMVTLEYTTGDVEFYASSSTSGGLFRTVFGSPYLTTNNPANYMVASGTVVPAPAAVPTFSEWTQLLLALMVIGIAWHFHNNRQNSY